MRTEEQQDALPINIIQARVERSLLCVAIGQVTLNLTVTINRSSARYHQACFRRLALTAFLVAMAIVLPDQVLAMNTPCSGKKGGVSHCAGGKFVCKDGTVSASKKICSATYKGGR